MIVFKKPCTVAIGDYCAAICIILFNVENTLSSKHFDTTIYTGHASVKFLRALWALQFSSMHSIFDCRFLFWQCDD